MCSQPIALPLSYSRIFSFRYSAILTESAEYFNPQVLIFSAYFVVLYRQNKSFGGQIHLRNKIVFSKQTNILIAPQFAHRKQGGFTIIEVLVTLLIIGVTLLLYTVISNSITLNKYNRYKEVALRSAETRLQDLRTVSYDSLPTSGTFTNAQIQTLPEGTANLEITEISTGLSEATVTVSWRSPSSNTMQEISLSTFLSEHGIGK
ncbi:TPA: hypothetical protein DCG61_00800 [Patescibacteria group bacterium]|nr:hypothetical protein [Patescibacteria group bacterium]